MARTARTSQPTLAVIDDEMPLLRVWDRMLRGRFNVATFHEPAVARTFFETNEVDVAVIDVRMPEIDGFSLLEHVRRVAPDTELIMMSGAASIPAAVSSMQRGARDFLCKPLDNWEDITDRIMAALARKRLRVASQTGVSELDEDQNLVGNSHSMERLKSTIARIAGSDVPVLIQGETGTGKELTAREIHRQSERKDQAFVPVNCAGITPSLIESELFGHERGSFTGANHDKKGFFEAANGGTLFLDEIGDMPPETQVRLLRVLQEGEIRRVGANTPIPVDVRIVAATHVDLDAAVRRGDFRMDLIYRLGVARLEVPALRDRIEDVVPITNALLPKVRAYREGITLSEEALFAFGNYAWPGNVRELRNALELGCALAEGDRIELAHLPPELRSGNTGARKISQDWFDLSIPYVQLRDTTLSSFEKRYLEGLLSTTDGNVSEASRQSGIDRANLRRMLKRHGLVAAKFHRAA